MDLSIDDIHQVSSDIWTSIVGLDIEPGELGAPTTRETTLTGFINVTGSWEGTVTLECPSSLAVAGASAMFGMEPDELGSEEIEDALGELTNMTGGGLKALLPSPCQLSLPTVVEGMAYRVKLPGSHLLREVAFACEGEQLVVRVFASDAAGA